MKQVMAIFKKDVRHLWPEIVVSLALVAALTMVTPMSWRRAGVFHTSMAFSVAVAGGGMGLVKGLLDVLIPVSWLMLIARAVHTEALVGDRQFWLTRPYEWPKLMASKLLFAGAFVCVPFVAAQVAMLGLSGFNPAQYAGGLALDAVFLAVFCTLPFLVFSAVTRTIGGLLLVLLGLVLLVVALLMIGSNLPSSVVSSVPDVVGGYSALAMLGVGCASAVVVQYATRVRWMPWAVLGVTTCVTLALAMADPNQPLMERRYAPGETGVALTYSAHALLQPVVQGAFDQRYVDIAMPMHALGKAQGEVGVVMGLRVTLDGPDGGHWQSQWQGAAEERIQPGEQDTSLRFRMPRALYDKWRGAALAMRVEVAVERARAARQVTLPIADGDFRVPGFGICKGVRWNPLLRELQWIACQSALNQPGLTHVSAQWSTGACNGSQPTPGGPLAEAWTGSVDAGPAEFGLTPLREPPMFLSNNGFDGGKQGRRYLCPGAPVEFTEYAPAGRARMEVKVEGFRLPDPPVGQG